ncbi:Macrophage mannose receptor 1, partial [Ophiophagus hannah]
MPSEIPQLPGKCQTSKNSQISWIPFRGHCYKIFLLMESWPAASMMCSHIGEWIWQDKSEVAFVNWNEQQLRISLQFDGEEGIEEFFDKCVYMNSNSGQWFTGHCGEYRSRAFICKRNKITEESTIKPTKISVQKGGELLSTHGTAVVVVIPIIFIVIGAGITAYIFYRRRNRPQQVSAGFDNSLYSDNVVILHKDSQSLVDNQELD